MAQMRMPDTLNQAGQMLWKMIVDRDPPYELRPDEWWILTQACAEADIIRKLELALSEDIERKLQTDPDLGESAGMTAKGSMGQVVINPMLPALGQHRQILAGLLKSLKLPDAKQVGSGKRVDPGLSVTRRAAARERWQTKEA